MFACKADIQFPSMDPKHVLEVVKLFLPENPVIVDAGAYDGKDDIPLFKKQWPHSKIYAFEPIPDIFDRLKTKEVELPGIICYRLALSDKSGKADIFVSVDYSCPTKTSYASSLLRPKEHLKYSELAFPKKIIVDTITLDEWADQNKIKNIDFLWLDLQGVELNVLKASPKILKTVKVIYTEVEFVEAYEGQYLFKDVDLWLTEQGFKRVARDFSFPVNNWFGNAVYVRI